MPMTSSAPITVGILTYNSVDVVGDAIRSVHDCAEILICDGGSIDGTRELALSLGCRLVDQDQSCLDDKGRLTNIAGVREQVLGLASNDWVLFLDSDELATPELVEEIARVTGGARTCGAYRVPRLFTLSGEIITCAMVYPTYQTRLVHRDAVLGYDGIVHDVPLLKEGETLEVLSQAQLVPQPPFRELWQKWCAYMKLEEVKKADLTKGEWKTQVLKPGLRGVRWLAYRYVKSLRECHGTRLPMRYEIGRLAYELGVVVYTGRRFFGIKRANLNKAWG